MKQARGWWWPDHEKHLLDWLANPKNNVVINGRVAYQGKKQTAALACVPADRRRTAIDVGAHIGLWSYNLGHWFSEVKAFEPVAAHRACFARNVMSAEDEADAKRIGTSNEPLWDDETLVALYPYALGDHEDMVSIHTADTSSGDSWVKGKGDVPMKTLDSFGFENVDFIKIDCEGGEELVLRGAERTVKTWKPIICVEQKRDHAQAHFGLATLGAVKLLQDWGYKVAAEISGDYLMTCA